MAKSEYETICAEILEAVGGSQNIKTVFHCITRLRIVPVNRDLVNMEKLNQINGLLKVIESSGQIQCVIGTTVPEKKPNLITQGLNTLASCVTPGLYAIVAGGFIACGEIRE